MLKKNLNYLLVKIIDGHAGFDDEALGLIPLERGSIKGSGTGGFCGLDGFFSQEPQKKIEKL